MSMSCAHDMLMRQLSHGLPESSALGSMPEKLGFSVAPPAAREPKLRVLLAKPVKYRFLNSIYKIIACP